MSWSDLEGSRIEVKGVIITDCYRFDEVILFGAPKRVHDKTILTAKTQITQSLMVDLFSFEGKKNR